jgi:hypothetical protein
MATEGGHGRGLMPMRYIVTVASEDAKCGHATTTLVVESDGGEPRVTEMTVKSRDPAGLISSKIPPIDLNKFIESIGGSIAEVNGAAAATATASPATAGAPKAVIDGVATTADDAAPVAVSVQPEAETSADTDESASVVELADVQGPHPVKAAWRATREAAATGRKASAAKAAPAKRSAGGAPKGARTVAGQTAAVKDTVAAQPGRGRSTAKVAKVTTVSARQAAASDTAGKRPYRRTPDDLATVAKRENMSPGSSRALQRPPAHRDGLAEKPPQLVADQPEAATPRPVIPQAVFLPPASQDTVW